MNPMQLTKEREGTFGRNANGQTTITFKRRLKHPIEKVWHAITDPAETATWFPALTELNLQPAGRVVMDFSGGDCPPNEHNPEDIDICEITALQPPELIEYLGPNGGLRFELTPVGDQCELVLTATNHPDMGILYSVVCGWHFYTDCLQWHLDGLPFDIPGGMGNSVMQIFEYYHGNKTPGFDG